MFDDVTLKLYKNITNGNVIKAKAIKISKINTPYSIIVTIDFYHRVIVYNIQRYHDLS